MKHLKRLLHGAIAVCIITGFISIVIGVCALIDHFASWHYRDDVLKTLLVLTILYMIGTLVELF